MSTGILRASVVAGAVVLAGCGESSDASSGGVDAGIAEGGSDARIDTDGGEDGGEDGGDDGGDDGGVEIPSERSAFGIFAGFTSEFFDYEQAAGMSHPEYLEWAG